jgi:molybdenum cofactor guanylyltransferase
MPRTAAIVLAGGRSSRMGAPKAWLDWHGSTLLRRVVGIVGRSLDGPVVVVGAPAQRLPELPAATELVRDPAEGRGPLQGLAAGLAAIAGRAEIAYASATDVPLLHPAFVRRVAGAFDEAVDAVLPEVDGHLQGLAAVYRVGLLTTVDALIADGELRLATLFEHCRVLRMPAQDLLRDPALAAADPELASLRNLNRPEDYEWARALPAPEVAVELLDGSAPRTVAGRLTVRAWSLGAAAAAAGVELEGAWSAAINGVPAGRDPELPLAGGDAVVLRVDNS